MIKEFEDILEIRNGKNQKNVENRGGKYPIYGSGGKIGYANDFLCEAGTVIIGRKGSINNPILVEEPFWNVDTAFGLCVDKEYLLPRYLYYFCKHFDFEKLNTTVTIPSLTKANLLKIKMNVPSLKTQEKVVKQLEKVEIIITSLKKRLKLMDELIKSRLRFHLF